MEIPETGLRLELEGLTVDLPLPVAMMGMPETGLRLGQLVHPRVVAGNVGMMGIPETGLRLSLRQRGQRVRQLTGLNAMWGDGGRSGAVLGRVGEYVRPRSKLSSRHDEPARAVRIHP
jgi:hypothetical protein